MKKGTEMSTLFNVVGGEYIDARYPESFVTFNFQVVGRNAEEAADAFHTVFPGCVLVSMKKA
jgi:hypothetical protein